MSATDPQALRAWIGRQQVCHDVIAPTATAGLSATLDYATNRAGAGDALPACWHWLYFLCAPSAATLAVDGHPLRGDFLPPVSLPRRMWAGSKLRFASPLYIGDEVQRVSTIEDVTAKRGRTGELIFVTVSHRIFCGDTLAIEEQQHLVYREASAENTSPVPTSTPAPIQPQWSRAVHADTVMLFRYSALTFNSHRIHFDRDYAVNSEGYGGLVVQGPLTATLLLDLLHRNLPEAQLVGFQFRGLKPLLDSTPLLLQGRADGAAVHLWALDAAGTVAMEAQAQLR